MYKKGLGISSEVYSIGEEYTVDLRLAVYVKVGSGKAGVTVAAA